MNIVISLMNVNFTYTKGLISTFSLLFLLNVSPASAQAEVFDDEGIAREMVLDENIKSIRLYKEGWHDSYPIITQFEGVPLVLDFDEISDYESSFYYSIVHCNANWEQSELYQQEYMDGFSENPINNYENSFNTYYNYVHYRLSIPNEDLFLTKSGNYLLIVTRDNDPENIVFTRRFMVSESAVKIEAKIKRPMIATYRDSGQEIDIQVDHSAYRIDDPYSETSISMYQNGIWDYGIHNLKPLFINPGELIYDYQEENVFLAGNEYRLFSTKTDNLRGINVQNIEYIPPYLHFELKQDEISPAHLYFERDDLNGRYSIENDRGKDADLDADYVFVHFNLRMPLSSELGDVYIAGDLTNWQFNELNKMQYSQEDGNYYGSLLLKQGIYSYRYIFKPHNSDNLAIEEIEGSHYETENEYLLLFYHRGMGDRHDKLVGWTVARGGLGG